MKNVDDIKPLGGIRFQPEIRAGTPPSAAFGRSGLFRGLGGARALAVAPAALPGVAWWR